MKKFSKALLAALIAIMPTVAVASANEDAVLEQLHNYLPGTSNLGKLGVEKVSINKKRRIIDVQLNITATYIPFTSESLSALKNDVASSLGHPDYRVNITADDNNLDELVLFAPKVNKGPKEKFPFIVRENAAPAPKGLDGTNIAVWQSHGWYFERKLNRWEWQRARIFQTVEDLYTQSYVMPFLMPMLENAGAIVLSPRERDTNTTEIIIDNDGGFATGTYSEQGYWGDVNTGFAYNKRTLRNGDHPFSNGTARKAPLSHKDTADAVASWSANIPADGTYAVYVSYATVRNSTHKAHYTVYAANGPHHYTVNQRMGGGTWVYLGHFPLKAGNQKIVELGNAGSNRRLVVTADAVKIGGGMGNVERIVKEPVDSIDYQYIASGYPRFTEGARYFLQWAGAPDSVFTPSDYVNDYTDDYKSRGLWVNWLTGGSSMLPNRKGLNIPIDLSFAWHTDAGTTPNDSIIGTLGIYCTQNGTKGNGSDASVSRDLTDLVMTEIVNDVRATYKPNWTRRGMWDKSYFEARAPEVPAMLLEFLSHQNFADMKYGLDPGFRFLVSRSVYKGMLRFLAHRDGRDYVVQPLPAESFAIAKTGDNSYRLSWAEQVDRLEETATPTYYIIEERIGDGAFTKIAECTDTEYTVNVSDGDIHSYRIIAANKGGVAFPSEILALCNKPGEPVTIVNGFTRVGAPDHFDSGEIAGFYDVRDHGVPYMQDISFIGSMFEFRRDIPWMDDDAAGFGASRSNYEDKVIAGNTFDYPYLHGQAIAAAGRGFVSSSVKAFINATDKPKTVDLILGKQKEILQGRGAYGPKYKTFPAELQIRMANLAASGTSFFVSGSYVASDLWDNPNSNDETAATDKEFARNVLGYNWRVGQACVEGGARLVDNRFKDFNQGEFSFFNELNADFYAIESPDSFYPANSEIGATIMRYTENNLVAGTAMVAPTHRAVVVGFPFETIKSANDRNNLMTQILNFFANSNPVRSSSTQIAQ